MISRSPRELLDIVDTWLDAQSMGMRDHEAVLQREASQVVFEVFVSAGAKFRTSRDLPASTCHSVNKLLKTAWEAVQAEVQEKRAGEMYKWWEGVVLLGNSSLETKKSQRLALLGLNTNHQKLWLEWRQRNLERGYRRVYTIGVAFGVPNCKRRFR